MTTELSNLYSAQVLARNFSHAQQQINSFLAPFIKDYAAFMIAETPRGHDLRDFEADTFVEIENESFYLTGDEVYAYSEYYKPTLSLPFAFVEDPKKFKAAFRQSQADLKAKADSKKKDEKTAMIERLKAQLARAEAELAKADTQNDPIRSTASRNRAKELRAKYIDS